MSALTIDGTDLSAADYGLLVASDFELPLMAEPRIYLERLSQADGVAIQGTTREAMQLKIPVAIVGTSTADAETKAANLVNFFETRLGTTYPLIWSERPTQQYTVTLTSGIDARLAITGAFFTLAFQETNGGPATI